MPFSPPVKIYENAMGIYLRVDGNQEITNQKEIKEILMKNNENRKTRNEKKERK